MLKDIWAVVKPWFSMSVSTTFFIITAAKLISKGDFDTLRSRKKFGEAWFGNFWHFMGPKAQEEAAEWVIPLLEGRVQNGRATVETDAVSHALEGVVLEIGAGSGMWTKVLADVARSSETGEGRTSIKVYGVEPNPMSAAALKRRVEQLGLDGRYEVIPVGIQDLQKESPLKPGSVDCIMTVQCLCSIPEPEKNMRLLYEYLKKGGLWYVYEHVRVDEGVFIPAFQSTLTFI
jgi:SAM-dependent methyltransferase